MAASDGKKCLLVSTPAGKNHFFSWYSYSSFNNSKSPINANKRKFSKTTIQLLFSLIDMIIVKMTVTKGNKEFAGRIAGSFRKHK